MKTKNLKCIFNWLYGNGSDRALTERQPREERGMKTSLYRPVSVSYLSAVLSSMHSQRGLLALARRIYSSKDNSVCLSRCGWSASRISLIALFLIGMSTNVWADDCTYSYTRGTYNTSIKNSGDVIAEYTFTNTYGLSAFSYTLTLKCAAAGADLTYKIQYLPSNSNAWTDTGISTGTLNGTWQAWRLESSETKNPSIASTSSIYNARGIRLVSTKTFKGNRTVSVSGEKFVMATTASMPATLTVGNANVDGNESNTFNFRHSNRNGQTITFSSDKTEFVVSPTSLTLDCDGEETITVTYKPTCANKSTSATITAKYGSTALATLTASATPQLVAQSVNWQEGRTTTIVAGESMNIEGYATSTSNIDDKPAIYYTSSASDVISVGADGHTLTANAAKVGQSAIITAHQDADCKYASATANQTFTVTSKLEPNIVLKVDGEVSDLTTLNLKVGDKVYVELENVSDGLDGDFTAAMTKSGVVSVTRLGNTLTIEALKEDATSVTLEQTANSTIAGASKTYTINVTRISNNLALTVSKFEMSVDDELEQIINNNHIAIASRNNTDIPVTVTSSDPNLIRYDASADKIIVPNDANEMFGASKVVTLTFSQPETYKYTAVSKTIDVTVKKYETAFGGSAYKMMVDGEQDADYAYTNVSAAQPTADSDDDFYYTIDEVSFTNSAKNKGTNLITFNPANKRITACNAGTAKITLHQKETYKYTGATASYNVAVYKYNSIFANVADLNVKVDENVSSAYTLTYTKPNAAYIGAANHTAGTPTLNSGDFYYTLTQDVQTSVTTGSPEPSLAITYNAGTKTATGKNAGKGTVHLYQRETYKYNAADEDFDVTVTKHSNTIKVKNSTSYSSSIYVDSYDNELTLTADNTDYTNYPITNTQTAGEDIATYYQGSNVVYSSYKLGTATWTLSQPENYKYQAGSGSFTVTVAKAAEAADCYVKTDINSEHKFSGSWETTWNDENAAGTLRFEACAQAAWTYGMNVYQLIDGNWSLIEYIDHDHMHTNYTDYSYSLDQRAKGVKFEQKGTLNRWVKNVYVTRSTYINASNVTIDRTSTNNPVYPSDGTGVGTLTINYSLANGGDLKIVNDNPTKFTLSQTTISDVDCKTGTATINISYESDEAGTDYAHLVIYNNVYRKEVTVTGITAKRNQEVHWEIGDALRVGTQTENAAWVTIGSEVSYSSSNTTLLEVVEGKLVAKAEGEVTITATAPGNGEYNDVEDQKTITITNDLIQSIVWEQNFLRLKLGGANQTLNAYVVSDVEGCTTDRARLITYESSDESVVKVISSNQLQIVGAGQAVLTARQAGGVDADGHKYMAVSVEKTVIVRDPNAPCDNYLYIQPQENKWDCGRNHANRQYREFIIDDLDEPSTLYLQYKGEYKTVAFDYFYGTMHVDEWYDGDWHEVPNGNLGTPTIGTYKTLNTTLQRKTTKVRIRTNDGVGYHYFKDCKIGQSRYIEEASDLTTFEAKVGQPVNQDLTIRYNNITGPVTLSLGSNNSKFSLSQQSIDGDCGDKGTVDVTVSYLPTVEADEEELLTVSDGTTTLKVTLHGVATKTSRHIVWDLPETNNVHTVDVVELGAQALTDVGNTTAGNVFYAISSSSPAGVGSVAGSNLTFAKAGTVVVTANTVNDARYNDAVAVSKNYNVAITPTTISTMPVLAEVTSGTAAGEIELTGWQVTNTVNGGVVEGTLAITSADLTNVGTNTVTLTFTPSNTNIYSGCTGTTTITVNKVTSTATPSASNIIYGQTLNSSTLTNTGTEGTWTWNTADNTAILPAGAHEGLAVHFTPASSNYTELDATVTLTVLKAEADATPAVAAITYGQKLGEATLTNNGTTDGAWVLVGTDADEEKNAGSYELDVHFTPMSSNYKEKDATVTLTVNKAASEATPSAAAIVAGQKVSESALTNSGTAGTWTWNDARNESILPEGTYNDLQVHFTPANPNMTELDAMVSLTVLPLPVNTFTNAAGDNDWSNPANWQSGVVPAGVTPDIVVIGELQLDNEAVEVGSLTIESTGSVAVIASGSITVQEASLERSEYGSLTIGGNGELIANANIQVYNFHIETYLADKLIDETPVQAYSGQVTNLHNLTVNGDVRFTVHLDPSGEASEGWYAFAVPFEVDAQTGVYDRNGNRLTYGTHYAIATYNGSKRAQGKRGWEYERATLRQGVFYMITVADEQYSTLVFQKKVGASLTNGSTSIALNEYALNGGQTGDEGWNGLANNQFHHVNLTSALTDKAQVYHHHTNIFETILLSDNSFVVASPFFIQAAGSGHTLMLETASHSVLYAPIRNGSHASEFCVRLGKDDQSYSDQLFLSADTEAANQYEPGQDLQKAQGVAGEAKVAQMSVSGYGMQLCDAAFPLAEDGTAFFPLHLTSPKAQSLQLYVQQAVAGQTLYLTYEGTPVWNLSESAYTIDLNKGDNNAYGLLLRQNAPQSATGIDTSASEVKTDKLIRNGVLYMLRDGILYDAQGKRVQ